MPAPRKRAASAKSAKVVKPGMEGASGALDSGSKRAPKTQAAGPGKPVTGAKAVKPGPPSKQAKPGAGAPASRGAAAKAPQTRDAAAMEKAVAEFKTLFREARREHTKAGRNATPESPAHQAALAHARRWKIPGAEELLQVLPVPWNRAGTEQALGSLEAALETVHPGLRGHAENLRGLLLADLKRYQEAIACYQRALDNPGYDTPGMAWTNLGTAYTDKGEHDRAIECYEKALATPGYDTPGMAWNNLGIAFRNKGEYDRAIECYEKALATPGYDTHGRAFYNLGVAYSNKGEHDRAIECYEKALATPGYDKPGVALNNLGVAYSNKGEHDRAIECYEKALATPGYDTPGEALNNLGIAFRNKGEYDRAIECYEKALATPGYDTPGIVRNNLGNVYSNKGEHDRAIECYEKALATPGYDTPGEALNNLGIAFRNKGEYDRAIECYEKALATPGYDRLGLARNNLALSLRLLKRYDAALAQVKEVLAGPDKDGQHERARRIRAMIDEEMAGLKVTPGEEALVKAESAGVGAPEEESVEQRMLKKLGQQETGRKDQYEKYLELEPAHGRAEVFSCLRGWSSAVTLLEGGGDGRKWRGGGYFIKWQGRGIVLDPGVDFLDNFHEAGHLLHEVDAVLVSHNHSDHNYDLGCLDDLRYELHRRWKVALSKPEESRARVLDLAHCPFMVDEDTAKNPLWGTKLHRGSIMKFADSDREHGRWYSRLHGLPFSVEHFKVRHGSDVPNAVGMRLRLHQPGAPDVVLGYTGDTEYFDKPLDAFSKPLAEELRGCDVLLAHISMPDQEEFKDPELLKRGHLGYNGLARLIVETEPKVVLVGEFWAGLADLRIDLVRGLKGKVQKALGREIPILPTGLGFHLDLTTLQVHCTGCGEARVPLAELKVAPAASAFGPLGYLCRRCLC